MQTTKEGFAEFIAAALEEAEDPESVSEKVGESEVTVFEFNGSEMSATDKFNENGTVDLNGMEIGRVGVWNGISFKEEDFDEIAANFNKLKKNDFLNPPVKIGHSEDQSLLSNSGEAAAGWTQKVYRKGQRFYADMTDVPRKVAELLKKKAFRHVSMEIFRNFTGPSGEKVGRTLKAVALLGASTPAIRGMKTLDTILSLYADDLEDGVDLIVCSEEHMTEAEKAKKAAEEKAAADKLADEKAAADKFAADKLADEKAAADKLASETKAETNAEIVKLQEALAKKDEEVSKLSDTVSMLTNQFVKNSVEKREAVNVAKYEALLRDGKVLPKQKDSFLTLSAALDITEEKLTGVDNFSTKAIGWDGSTVVAGKDGDGKEIRSGLKDLWLNFVASLDPQVEPGTVRSKNTNETKNRELNSGSEEYLSDKLNSVALELVKASDGKLDFGEALAQACIKLEQEGVSVEDLIQ